MANYSLVSGASFKPFSYQELAAPLDRMEAYHDKLAEEYDKLSAQADVLEIMGTNDLDKNSDSYNQYKKYSDSLRREADDLYRHGLNTESRQRLSDLRRMYNTDIVPIQNAWNQREKEANAQLEASMKNPSLMFTRDARNSSIDYYRNNPVGGYGVINGANITAQMADMASKLATQVRSGVKENIDPYTYNYIEKYGLDENIINDWQNYPTLKTMVEQIMQANGVTPEALASSTNAQDIMNKSLNYAEMGMWHAIGQEKTHQMENYGARLAAQEAKERRMADYKGSGSGSSKNGGTGYFAINPSNIFSQEEAVRQNENLNKYKDYFTTDSNGNTVLNEKGLKEYNTPVYTTTYLGSGIKTKPSQFKQFVDEYLGGETYIPGKDYSAIGKAWNEYGQKDYLKYDATKLTEYKHNIDPTEYNNWTARIQEAANGKLDKVTWDKKKKQWVTEDKVDVKDVFKTGSNPTSTQSSKYGRTFTVVDKDGNVTRYRMPRGINSRAEQNIQIQLDALDYIQSLANQLDNKGQKTINVNEAKELNSLIGENLFMPGMIIDAPTLQAVNRELENNLATFESQMGLTNTNKPQEWSAVHQ